MREKLLTWLRRNLLTAALLLTSFAAVLAVYSVIELHDERAASILRSCGNQNTAHTNTLATLHQIIGASVKRANPQQRPEILAAESAATLIINSLAPYQNCRQLLAKSSTK